MSYNFISDKREVNFPAVFLIALLFTVLTFLIIKLISPSDTYFYLLFFERSWIQYVTTYCFWFIIISVLFKQLHLNYENKAFEAAKKVTLKLKDVSTQIWADAPRVRENFVEEQYQAYQKSLVFSRIIYALDRLRKTQSTNAFENYFRTRSDIDRDELESSYSNLRYLTWLVPTLGFLGTVMGIGIGINGFAGIIANALGEGKFYRKP